MALKEIGSWIQFNLNGVSSLRNQPALSPRRAGAKRKDPLFSTTMTTGQPSGDARKQASNKAISSYYYCCWLKLKYIVLVGCPRGLVMLKEKNNALTLHARIQISKLSKQQPNFSLYLERQRASFGSWSGSFGSSRLGRKPAFPFVVFNNNKSLNRSEAWA